MPYIYIRDMWHTEISDSGSGALSQQVRPWKCFTEMDLAGVRENTTQQSDFPVAGM